MRDQVCVPSSTCYWRPSCGEPRDECVSRRLRVSVFRDGSAMDVVGGVHTLVLRAASRLLLFVTVSVSVFSFPVAARTTEISLELDRNATAPCSELAEKLSRRRERLEAAIAQVDAETARVEAQCAGPMHPANDQGRTDAGVPVALPQFFALTSVPGPRGTADDATGIRQVAPESVTVRSPHASKRRVRRRSLGASVGAAI